MALDRIGGGIKIAHAFAAIECLQRNNPGVKVSFNNIARELDFDGFLEDSNRELSRLGCPTCRKIDLHGLFVAEAVSITTKALMFYRARQLGVRLISFVVGKGLHSPGGISRLKPTMSRFLLRDGNSISVHDGQIIVKI